MENNKQNDVNLQDNANKQTDTNKQESADNLNKDKQQEQTPAPKNPKQQDKSKKRKGLILGLSLGLGIPIAIGAIVGIVLGAKSCNNKTNSKAAIDIRTNPGNNIYIDQVVSASKSVVLGSFRLIDNDGNVVTQDKTSEITLAFTSDNKTGFTNDNLSIVYNENDNTYQVSLISGKSGNEPCTGNVSISWKNGNTTIVSPSQLNVHIIDVTKKTLITKVLGSDCKTPYSSEQVIPVVVGSGIYLELTDPDNGSRIDANWMVLGGGANVNLLNTNDETPINALMVNVAPTAETIITVKAFPIDSVLYNDAVFSIKIQASTTDPTIVAQEQTTDYLLQYQSTQAVVNDTINFTLNNATVTNWAVTDATGGDRSDPAQTSDISFNSEDPTNGTLTIHKTYIVGATYTIQATYGESLSVEFKLLLTAGGIIEGSIKKEESEATAIQKNRQLSADLAIGDTLTFSLNDYSGPIEYWTAVYDARTPYSIPGFTSPTSGDRKTATWTITQADMDSIPAGSHIYINAYKANSSKPVATFIFQTKVHVLTSLQNNGEDCPKTYTDSKWWGYKETLDKTKFTAKLDQSSDQISVEGKILPSVSDDYRVENVGDETSMIIQRGGRANVVAPIECSYTIPETGVKVVTYSSINFYGVWDLYSFKEQQSTSSVDLNISKDNYESTSSQTFVLYKNGEPCNDAADITWTKGTITSTDLDGDPANVNNYDIEYDTENKCWKVNFTVPESPTAPTAANQSGTLTFTAKYPGSAQPQPSTNYPFPVITINIKTV